MNEAGRELNDLNGNIVVLTQELDSIEDNTRNFNR
jgi:hypothetical protein